MLLMLTSCSDRADTLLHRHDSSSGLFLKMFFPSTPSDTYLRPTTAYLDILNHFRRTTDPIPPPWSLPSCWGSSSQTHGDPVSPCIVFPTCDAGTLLRLLNSRKKTKKTLLLYPTWLAKPKSVQRKRPAFVFLPRS